MTTFPWQRLALTGILLLGALLDFFQLNEEGYANTYYAAAVKSMLLSWHNFFYVAFDPAGFLAVDKPPLGLWIQAASARVFGFSGVSLLLPQALAGVLSVAVLYVLVTRVFGYSAGLLAALGLALTPIAVIDNRNNTPDSLLILTLLLAAWAVLRAVETGRLRWLLLGAVLVGLGFNIKELQAYLVLPALFLAYLAGRRPRWYTRLWHLFLAGLVALLVSFCWIVAVDLTPATQRPYVTDSGTNSELSLALGYNGLGRLTAGLLSHLPALPFLHVKIDLAIAPGFSTDIGNPGLFRLFSPEIGEQVSWLLPLALIGLLLALWQSRRQSPRRLDLSAQRAPALALWGAWLLTGGFFFSVARFYHLYYLTMLAPAVAALAGIGLVALWNDYREGLDEGRQWQGWLLPLTLLLTAAAQANILGSFAGASGWPGWLAPLVVGLLVLVAATLIAVRLHLRFLLSPDQLFSPGRGAALMVAAVGTLSLLIAPTAWSGISLADGNGGAWLPQAGPSQGFGGGFGPGRGFSGGPPGDGFTGTGQPPTAPPSGNVSQGGSPTGGFQGRFSRSGSFRGFGGGGFGGAGGAITFAGSQIPTLNAGLLRYLQEHRQGARYLVGTTTTTYASLFILDTGQPVMTLGGYQGWDKILTVSQLKRLVAKGTIHFFLLSSSGGNGFGNLPSRFRGSRTGSLPGRFRGFGNASLPSGDTNLNSVNNDLIHWIESTCSVVPSSKYETTSGSTSQTQFGGRFGSQSSGWLYDCAIS